MTREEKARVRVGLIDGAVLGSARAQAIRRAMREMMRLGITRYQLMCLMDEAHAELLAGVKEAGDEGDW